ncbi:MAG TPA: DUF3175 domain-containing protein [Candidatus Eremiobacteraceae bacterium]|nr:DUF3175 domain-containing protein [Candidatus Eremiobacteraceae bacterium]
MNAFVSGNVRAWQPRISAGLNESRRTATRSISKKGVFAKRSAKQIASSLKRSAEHSKRRKSPAYRSAMSMLTFYINRAGKKLAKSRLRTLERAKGELRNLYGKSAS